MLILFSYIAVIFGDISIERASGAINEYVLQYKNQNYQNKIIKRSLYSSRNKCSRNSINLSNIIDSLLHDYDTHLLPESEGVNVTIELHVQGVSGISEITADFELDIMYSEIWLDPRLSFKHLNVCATNITLKSDFRGF